MTTTDYDLLIVGGGMVGASLACALGDQPLRIAVVEAVASDAPIQPSYDDRAIALAAGTRRIFEGMGLWADLCDGVTPIHRIHVSDRGRFGFARLDCREQGVEALGYVAPAHVLGAGIGARLRELPAVDLICPARVESVQPGPERATVRLSTADGTRDVRARLVVAADGARSAVREQLAISSTCWEYGQTAIVTNITAQLDHDHVAFERFTDTGPLAMLPMDGRRCAVVWTVPDAAVDETMRLDDDSFLARLQERFGQRLGRLEQVGRRYSYPLRLIRAREPVRERLALIGNAAHTLHPIAGQGFNLGLRDVAVLAQVLSDALRAGEDIGGSDVLRRYGNWRKADYMRVITFTDGLARIFANPLGPVGLVRDAAMVLLDMAPPAKRALAKLTMGRAGRLPRLACGLPLRGRGR